MKLEQRMIATVHDQSLMQQVRSEVFRVGPEIAWSFDRKAADLYVARHPNMKLHVMEREAEILTRDGVYVARIMVLDPIMLDDERKVAKAALLARLTPEERELL